MYIRSAGTKKIVLNGSLNDISRISAENPDKKDAIRKKT
jgi:hypothetical protein